MSDYHHGVQVVEVNDGTRVISTVSTAIIGMVCTASDADAATFPLNVPVLITNVQSAIAKAGKKGTLAAVLQAIADQAKPVTIVVRVAEGTGDSEEALAQTVSNIIGGTDENGQLTGMKALLTAEAVTGVKPRILGVPGFDTLEVAVALASICQKLRAFGYVSAWGCKTLSEVIAYRKNFGQRELMLIWPDFIAWNTSTSASDTAFATARALGLRARIDQETGWHKTLSNVAVNGVKGLANALLLPLKAFDKLREGITWVLEKLGIVKKESDALDAKAEKANAVASRAGGMSGAAAAHVPAGMFGQAPAYQAYQPVSAAGGRSYIDQSRNQYNISVAGGAGTGGAPLAQQMREELERIEREKRARSRASMGHDG